ncbi:hypothetical protein [Vibrio sinaloensis]|uniref:Lipoprotein n=1 Tax=Photobacterium sp. (strain ATCC 43367) TaxID=379097 RepID=A0A0A5HZM7_PHOS4|nr:hypothetical protein [Vibrio sinaloensis]KGY09775.1 lipoprotein [Vibrio sinaloensis]
MATERFGIILSVVGISALMLLVGCSEEKAVRMLNKQTYEFTGVFENQYNQDLLKFSDAQVTFIREGELNMTKPFEVKGNDLTITMRNSSKEKREDIVMRIHGQNELLTCSTCAKYQLASVWQKRDFTPLPVESN